MNYIPLKSLAQAKRKLKKKGYELKGWALAQRLNPDSLSKFFRGKFGRQKGGPVSNKIIAALIQEGCWPDNDESQRAA